MECIIKNRPKAGSLGGGSDVESKDFQGCQSPVGRKKKRVILHQDLS